MDTMLPNRWYTTISVEIYDRRQLRYIKWFSDLQMAYLWVKDHLRTFNEPFTMENDFIRFADRMDQRWTQRHDGCTLASNSRYKYRVYYEPDVPFRHEDQQQEQQQPRRIQNNDARVPILQLPNHILHQIDEYQNNLQQQPQQPFVFRPMNNTFNTPTQTPQNH
jgi:hypothetical protein